MTIKASGPISGNDIRTEFGGTGPISPSNYYRVAGLDAADRVAGQVPSTMTTGGGGSELATIEVDFTGVTTPSSGIIISPIRGSWLEDPSDTQVFGAINTALSSTELATSFAGVMNAGTLADGVVIESEGAVVTITSPNTFTFWVTAQGASGDGVFTWDSDYPQIPEIRVNGTVYPTVDTEDPDLGTAPAEAQPVAVVDPTNETILIEFSQAFNAGTAGDTASYLFDIDVGGDHFPGPGGTIDIDCTNATGDGSGSIAGYLQGSWRTDSNEFFIINQPTTASDIAEELFVEANTSLRSDITVTRGTGIGNSFTEDTDGLVVRISSSDEGFSFFMTSSTFLTRYSLGMPIGTSFTNYLCGWSRIPYS